MTPYRIGVCIDGELVNAKGVRFNIADIDSNAMTIKLKPQVNTRSARKEGEYIVISFADIGDEYTKPAAKAGGTL